MCLTHMLHLPNSVWILNQQLSNLQEVNVTTEQSFPLFTTKHRFDWDFHFFFPVNCTSHNTRLFFPLKIRSSRLLLRSLGCSRSPSLWTNWWLLCRTSSTAVMIRKLLKHLVKSISIWNAFPPRKNTLSFFTYISIDSSSDLNSVSEAYSTDI